MKEQERAKVEVFRIDEQRHPYPWRFRISYRGVTHTFAGIPNQCATKREAAARARWRAKWLEDGSFDQRYKFAGLPQ